ncbi:RHS repeat domain-containing protein [Streptomyces clavifer]|uniref:RHS repeat domain-containing protein n=1 Tax=Streptomyces clavifer TaxID=68188 RepID=UPI00378B5CCF
MGRAAPRRGLRPVRAAAAHHGVGGPHGRRNGRHPAGDLAKTTDTEGKYTLFGYDSSNRPAEITTPRAG